MFFTLEQYQNFEAKIRTPDPIRLSRFKLDQTSKFIKTKLRVQNLSGYCPIWANVLLDNFTIFVVGGERAKSILGSYSHNLDWDFPKNSICLDPVTIGDPVTRSSSLERQKIPIFGNDIVLIMIRVSLGQEKPINKNHAIASRKNNRFLIFSTYQAYSQI